MSLVCVPPIVRERIAGVKPCIRLEAREHLGKLGKKPLLGTPLTEAPFKGQRAYRFRVDRLPLSREFAFLYEFDKSADRVRVLDFGVLVGSPPVLHAPGFRVERSA